MFLLHIERKEYYKKQREKEREREREKKRNERNSGKYVQEKTCIEDAWKEIFQARDL